MNSSMDELSGGGVLLEVVKVGVHCHSPPVYRKVNSFPLSHLYALPWGLKAVRQPVMDEILKLYASASASAFPLRCLGMMTKN